MADPAFEWTNEKAKIYLEEQNKYYWGTQYDQHQHALIFDNPDVGHIINEILKYLSSDVGSQNTDEIASVTGNMHTLAKALSEAGDVGTIAPLSVSGYKELSRKPEYKAYLAQRENMRAEITHECDATDRGPTDEAILAEYMEERFYSSTLSAEDRAHMIMSAADFLGIEYDQTIFPKVSFFPSPEQ